MQIVIDIPENAYYNFMILGKKINNVEERQIIQAFEDATPLPKGHGRLIDATILRRGFVVSARFNGTWNLGKTRILSHIDDANAIIEADKESE